MPTPIFSPLRPRTVIPLPDWTPAQIDTFMWFSGENVTMDGVNVITLRDLSGNHRHATIAGGAVGGADTWPQIETINGMPFVSNNNENSYRPYRGAITTAGDRDGFHTNVKDLYVVFRTTDAAWVNIQGQSTSFYNLAIEDAAATSPVTAQTTNPVVRVDGTNHTISTRDVLHSATSDGSVHMMQSAWDDYTGTITSFFYYPTTGFYFTGDYAEIIALPAKADEETRQKIEGYLAHKYSIALPPGHPYEFTNPKYLDIAAPVPSGWAFWFAEDEAGADATALSSITLSDSTVFSQASGPAQPILDTINGVRCMTFSGAQSLEATGTIWGQEFAVYAFVKFKDTGVTTNSSIIDADTGGGSGRQFQLRRGAQSNLEFLGFNTGLTAYTSTRWFEETRWSLVGGTRKSTEIRSQLNGRYARLATAGTPAAYTINTAIGSRLGGTAQLANAHISAIAIRWSGATTEAEIEEMSNYVESKCRPTVTPLPSWVTRKFTMDSLSSLSIGDPVATWGDDLTALEFLQASPSQRPTYQGTHLAFDGTDDRMLATITLTQPYTIVVVADDLRASISYYIDGGASGARQYIYRDGNSIFGFGVSTIVNHEYQGRALNIVGASFNGASSAYYNGNTFTRGLNTGTAVVTTTLSLCASYVPSAQAKMNVKAVFIAEGFVANAADFDELRAWCKEQGLLDA